MAGDEEGDDLVADVGEVQGGAVGGVRGAEHEAEQVVGRGVAGGRTGGDDLVDDAREEVGVLPERLVLGGVVAVRRASELAHAPLQAADHGSDEGVRLVAGERLEVVAEPGEADGVERHPRHVLGDLDGGAPGEVAVPAADQAACDAEHGGVVGAHGAQGEGGHQDVVRLGPVGFVVVGGEQPVGGEFADVLQPGPDALGEPFLVGELGDQVEPRDEDDAAAVPDAAVDGAVLPGQLHGLLDGGVAGCVGDVDLRNVRGRTDARTRGRTDARGGARVTVREDHIAHVSSLAAPPGRQAGRHCMIVQWILAFRSCAGRLRRSRRGRLTCGTTDRRRRGTSRP